MNVRILNFFSPLYFVTWIFYLLMRLLALLPHHLQISIGKILGKIIHIFARKRRKIADSNIKICFPRLNQEEKINLRKKHFECLGISLTELSMAWFGSKEKIRSLIKINGKENLEIALSKGKGVILFCGHFTTFEFFFPALESVYPKISAMYRSQKNELLNKIMTKGRERSIDHLYPEENVRDMIKSLSNNYIVWYAPDQSYQQKYSSLINFFGIPTMTNTATSRIAKISGAAVLTYFCKRLPNNKGYILDIGKPIKNFPTGNINLDTQYLMDELQSYIKECPEQYNWIHRKFKGSPKPYSNLYNK
ncbi:MAG: hypothetical protein CMQ51_07600 [Gammaproteobacteria bacterium]|nr:hypothetical protein [Gammaproteobacteria bacterium]